MAVTSGYMTPEARQPFYEVIDAANVDLKAFSERFYRKLTGGRLDPVCDTLRWLVRDAGVWTEITTLIIPRENDSDDELKRMSEWIVEELGPNVPVHFSAFHPDFRMLDRPPTPPETLLRARELARRAGINYVYTGNIADPATQSTYCHACQGLLIERSGYRIGHYAMCGDRCGHCQAEIPGRFSTRPGTWGSRRQPVRIASFARPRAERRSPQHQPANQPIPNEGGGPPSPDTGHRTRFQGESAVALPGAASTAHGDRHPEKPELDRQQERRVFEAAGRRVAAAVSNLPGESTTEALAAVAAQPLLGAFVSLKRSGQLRSCCGFIGQSVPLGEAIDQAASGGQRGRFPPISPTELPHLEMEVWLLWGLKPVEAKGGERAGAVTIGRHGLQIAMGNRRGLLLPGVATEHKMDAVAFLEAVCRKAGLPGDAWKKDDATLMTFEGYAIEGRLADVNQAGETPVPAGGPDADQVAELADSPARTCSRSARGPCPAITCPAGSTATFTGWWSRSSCPRPTKRSIAAGSMCGLQSRSSRRSSTCSRRRPARCNPAASRSRCSRRCPSG